MKSISYESVRINKMKKDVHILIRLYLQEYGDADLIPDEEKKDLFALLNFLGLDESVILNKYEDYETELH